MGTETGTDDTDSPAQVPPAASATAWLPRRAALGAGMAALGALGLLAAGCERSPANPKISSLYQLQTQSQATQAAAAAQATPSYNVRSHGAFGDGRHDDTAAIQATIAAAAQAGGGTVLLPAGTYPVNGITLAAGVDLRGEGRDNTSLRFALDSGNVVTVPQVGFNRLADFQITYARAVTVGAAIHLDKAFTITIDGVFVNGGKGLAQDGIVLDQSTAIFVRDFNIYGCQGDGIRVQGPGGNDAYFAGGIINLGQTASGAGVHIQNFPNGAVNITDADILLGKYSLLVEGSNYLRFENTYFDSSDQGAVLQSGHLITFANCWFSNRPGPGLHVGTVSGCSVVGGQAANCGGHGIHITDNARYVSLAAVQVVGNNTQGNGSDGILVDNGAAYVTVQGCMVGHDPQVFGGPGQNVGIHVASTAGSPYALVGNMVFGNTVAQVLDHGQGGYAAGNL